MPNSTVTVREVKNKEAGLDLFIPAHKETPGLFQTIVEFHVVCVSKLSCFKSPKHKESDTVQFMVPKKVEDFEKLRKNLSIKNPGMVLPEIPKSVFGITITDSSILERRHVFDQFVNFIASVPKLALCHHTLEFLGVNPITAGKFSSGQPVPSVVSNILKISDGGKDIFEEAREVSTPEQSSNSLFGSTEENNTESEDEDDLFKPIKSKDDAAMIFAEEMPKDTSTRLFESPDLGEGINEDEEDLFLVPGAKDHQKNVKIEVEDNSEILKVEEDLDKLLQLNVSAKKRQEDEYVTKKPRVSAKPIAKPKPLPKKPSLFEDEDLDEEETTNLKSPKPSLPPKPGRKPKLAPKPKAPSKSKVAVSADVVEREKQNKDSLFGEDDSGVVGDNFDADDILKYIQSNGPQDGDDLDLFS